MEASKNRVRVELFVEPRCSALLGSDAQKIGPRIGRRKPIVFLFFVSAVAVGSFK
jgi:hypothetical protein